MPKKVVFDSSLLVAAFIRKGGLAHAILSEARNKKFNISVSKETFAEIEDVLFNRPKLREQNKYTDEEAKEYLEQLKIVSEWVTDIPEIKVVRDVNDDIILATAIKAEADYLVTYDKDLLVIGTYEDIKIVKPDQFIFLVRKNFEEEDE
jgi:putative PIN family toxin of toxin-antitoxin system